MKITYAAPVRPHPYKYAEAFERANCLHAFISGFSRLSPRSPLPTIGNKLKRHDHFWTVYLACLKLNMPDAITSWIHNTGNLEIDKASYPYAEKSDVFIYYRTTGMNTARILHKKKSPTICIMEEVNSHIEYANDILKEEHTKLRISSPFKSDFDYHKRLEAYDDADFILCPSGFVKRSFLSKGFQSEKLIQANFGFPKIEIDSPKLYLDDTFRVLYVGQINYRKGLRYAIRAFDKLSIPKKEFFIVGPKTSITGLEDVVMPRGVYFTGPLKGSHLQEQYRRASLFILPSLEEGLALVQGEALSFGTPLLITTNTGGEDLITNGIEGYIVPPADEYSLLQKMEEMATNKNLLRIMSLNALETARNLGSWDMAVKKILTSLNPIIEQHA